MSAIPWWVFPCALSCFGVFFFAQAFSNFDNFGGIVFAWVLWIMSASIVVGHYL